MKTFFLVFGLLAALTTSSNYSMGYNIAAAIIAASCFICAVFMQFMESKNETLIELTELKLRLAQEENKNLALKQTANKPENATVSIEKN